MPQQPDIPALEPVRIGRMFGARRARRPEALDVARTRLRRLDVVDIWIATTVDRWLDRIADALPEAWSRQEAAGEQSGMRGTAPVARFVAIGIVATLVLLLLAGASGALIPAAGATWWIGAIVHPSDPVDAVPVPLLTDPEALAIVAAAFLTPLFCAQQIKAIGFHVQDTRRNMAYSGLEPKNVPFVLQCITHANQDFTRLGRPLTSLVNLLLAAVTSTGLYLLVSRYGLMASWKPAGRPAKLWSHMAYAGWWANGSVHPVLAAALVIVGTYLFYYLFKQLRMGVIFAVFAHRTREFFGTTPNLRFNADGYWGLRTLRAFMWFTYMSALTDFLAALGMFTSWMPFNWWSVIALYCVMTTNLAVVFYPSIVARNSIISARRNYIRKISTEPGNDTCVQQIAEDSDAGRVQQIWDAPNLPFRVRSAFSAVTLYLLVPIILLVVGAVLKT